MWTYEVTTSYGTFTVDGHGFHRVYHEATETFAGYRVVKDGKDVAFFAPGSFICATVKDS